MATQPTPSTPHLRLKRADFGASKGDWNDWRWQYAHRIRSLRDLRRIPWLEPEEIARMARVARRYPFAATPYLLTLVRWEDPQDPVRRQILPSPAETGLPLRGSLDPLGEEEHSGAPGLIHRYPDRAVVLATHRCAVFCRHCFRKRLWKEHPVPNDALRWNKVIGYLEDHTEIRDVLLSGGDPLTLPDGQLDRMLGRIRRVRHVEIIRVGSRAPVALPQRITPDLCRVLDRHGPLWLITQFNHSQEITPEAAGACERLLRCGVPVNNQTVLLRGVNDHPETIRSLCRGLLRIRVRPYYLHQCDPVAGAEHFRTPLARGIQIVAALQGATSGLAVPRFMVDLPGKAGKVPLQGDSSLARQGDCVLLRSFTGEVVPYEDPAPERDDRGAEITASS